MADALIMKHSGTSFPIHLWRKYELNRSYWYTWNMWNAVETVTYRWNKWSADVQYTWEKWTANEVTEYTWNAYGVLYEEWTTWKGSYETGSNSVDWVNGQKQYSGWYFDLGRWVADNSNGIVFNPSYVNTISASNPPLSNWWKEIKTTQGITLAPGSSSLYKAGTNTAGIEWWTYNTRTLFFKTRPNQDSLVQRGVSKPDYNSNIYIPYKNPSSTPFPVTTTTANLYPNNSYWGSYWYELVGSNSYWSRQVFQGYVTSSSSSTYPNGNIWNDGFYYYNRTSSYKQGTSSYGEVEAINNPNAYPTNGWWSADGYWYVSAGSTSEWSQGSTYQGELTATSSSAYPNNDHTDDIWYEGPVEHIDYSQGSYIEDIMSTTEGKYPENGPSGDYWYVYYGIL